MAKHTAPGWLGDLEREATGRVRAQRAAAKREEAARAMLAALNRLMKNTPMLAQESEAYRGCLASRESVKQALAAIAQAEAAGIK